MALKASAVRVAYLPVIYRTAKCLWHDKGRIGEHLSQLSATTAEHYIGKARLRDTANCDLLSVILRFTQLSENLDDSLSCYDAV
jgi:hypothetical protein